MAPSIRSLARSSVRRIAERLGLFADAPARAASPAAAQAAAPVIGERQAMPARWGVRSPWVSDLASDLTPEGVAGALQDALRGHPARQAQLIRQISDRDPHLVSVLSTRKRAVANLGWTIRPQGGARADKADRAVAEAVDAELRRLTSLRRGALNLLEAVGTGYAGVEIGWGWRSSRLVPKELLYRPAEWLRPSLDDPSAWRVIDASSPVEGVPLSPRHWILHTSQAKAGWPVEAGLGRCFLWLYVYCRYGITEWAGYNERHGMPLRVGVFPEGADAADIDALDEAVQQLGVDASAIIKAGWDIKFVSDTGNKTGGDTYEKFLAYLDRAKSKLVLGQTLTTEAGQTGTQALGTVQADVRRDLRDSDAHELAGSLNEQLIMPFVQMNFGEDVPAPEFCWDLEPPADEEVLGRVQKGRAEVFAAAKVLGVPVAVGQVRDELGLREPEAGEAVLGAPAASPDPAVAPGMTPAVAPAGLTVAEAALNGAQIASLLQILAVVSAGSLSTSAAVALIRVSFPTISAERAAEIVAGATPAPASGAMSAADLAALGAAATSCCGILSAADSASPGGAFASLASDAAAGVRSAWKAILGALQAALESRPVGSDPRAAITAALPLLQTDDLVNGLADATLRAEALGLLQVRTDTARPRLPSESPVDDVATWAKVLELPEAQWGRTVATHITRAENNARVQILRACDTLVAAVAMDQLAVVAEAEAADPRRTDGLVSVAAGIAWGQGRAGQQERERKRKPFYMYRTMEDDRVRVPHRAMQGKIYAADHPIWDVWAPPNGWNCRCWRTAHTAEEVEKNGWVVSSGWPTLADADASPAEGVNLSGEPALPDPKFRRNFLKEPEEHDFSSFPAAWKLALGVKDAA